MYCVLRSFPSLGLVGCTKLLLAFITKLRFSIKPKGYRKGVLVRGGTSDPMLLYKIFTMKEYPYINDPQIDLIIDAGANVGYSSVYFAHNYPNAKIVAIEPEISNYSLLSKNIEEYANVDSIQKPLWWRNANMALVNPDAEKWAFYYEECHDSELKSVTLPDLIGKKADHGKILVKLDIEGGESEIFSKDSSWIRDVDYLFLEIHDCWKNVFDALGSHDYHATICGENLILSLERGGCGD